MMDAASWPPTRYRAVILTSLNVNCVMTNTPKQGTAEVTMHRRAIYSPHTMKAHMHKLLSLTLILALTVMSFAQASQQQFDVIIRGGSVYDGSGRAPVQADVGIKGDRIAAVGDLSRATAPTVVDAKG